MYIEVRTASGAVHTIPDATEVSYDDGVIRGEIGESKPPEFTTRQLVDEPLTSPEGIPITSTPK